MQHCSTLDEYVKDKRMACRYGAKCYQKNPQHHEKYKHPPKKANSQRINTQPAKKLKVENEDKTITTVKINKDISDSESDHESVTDGEKQEIAENSDTNNSAVETKESDKETQDHTTEKTKDNETQNPKVSENIDDAKQFIKNKFLVDMPEDFYQFWKFCTKLNPKNPLHAFKEVGLVLIGPFDVLAGKFDGVSKPDADYLIHWRYFHDTPEFQSVLKGDIKRGFHIGYWRDDPKELPVFMVQNCAKINGEILTMGENIFSAVNMFLMQQKKDGNPFQKVHIGKLEKALLEEVKALNLDLGGKTKNMVAREKNIVTRTFNKIGLVVPYNKKTQLGYRELALSNKDLKKALDQLALAGKEDESACLSKLQPCFTYASIALDECDFGTGIELGWNIIAHGVDSLNSTASRFLQTSYELLGRHAFAKIAEAHMKNRREGTELSIL